MNHLTNFILGLVVLLLAFVNWQLIELRRINEHFNSHTVCLMNRSEDE